MLVQFSELILLHWNVKIFATLAKVQPAEPPLRMSYSYVFLNAGDALEDTQGSLLYDLKAASEEI